MSHLGRHYDLWEGSQPLRIVVVGQEDGGDRPHAGLAERRAFIADRTGLERRFYAGDGRSARTSQDRGSTTTLRLLMGRAVGSDFDSEWFDLDDGSRAHIFDMFALVNVLLCSAVTPGTVQGRSSSTMRKNCLPHFEETLHILEPTVVVLHGVNVRQWTRTFFTERRQFSPNLFEASLFGREMLVCAFSHPAARASLNWGNTLRPLYVNDVVEPTLKMARQMLGLSTTPSVM